MVALPVSNSSSYQATRFMGIDVIELPCAFKFKDMYFLLIIDRFSRYIWIIFLKSKRANEVNRALQLWTSQVESIYEFQVKTIRADDGELRNSGFTQWATQAILLGISIHCDIKFPLETQYFHHNAWTKICMIQST